MSQAFEFDEQSTDEHDAYIDLVNGDISTVYGSVVIRKTENGILVDVRDIHGDTVAHCKAAWDDFNTQEDVA